MRPLLSAEMLKLLRQPALLFWGYLAVPLVALLFKVIIEGLLVVRFGFQAGASVDLFGSAAKSLSLSGNSLAQLLYALGVASVFFFEYRYSTWRLLVPRHARSQLFAAKYLTCLLLLALGLLLAVCGDMLVNLLLLFLKGQGFAGLVLSGGSFAVLVGAFAIALLELAVLAALVAALVILSRSLIGAVIPAFLLAIGSTLLQLYLGADADRLPLPSYAAQSVRDWLLEGGPAALEMTGLAVLVAWCVGLIAVGLFAFSRQQLATE